MNARSSLAGRFRFVLLIAAPLVLLTARAVALEGEGEVDVLAPVHRDGAPAEDVALRKDGILAGAGFGMYLRGAREVNEQSLEIVREFAQRDGMRNRAAFLLVFNSHWQKQLGELVNALVETGDREARELAATILVTAHCADYVSDPDLFPCARSDQRAVVLASAGKAGDDADDSKQQKKKKKARRKGRKRLRRLNVRGPAIPEALFGERLGDTADMAAVAAAFRGKKEDREALQQMSSRSPQYAGALLLYHAQIEEALPDEQVMGMFQAAMRAKPGLSRRSADWQPFDPMMPGGCLACIGLGRTGDAKYLPLLLQALQADDMRVRIEAVRAIRRIGPDEKALAALAGMLERCEWPVLVEICATLGRSPDKRVIPALVQRLGKETGRFRLDLVHALSAIAGEQKGNTADDWAAWWKAEGADFAVDPEASAAFCGSTRVQDVIVPALGIFYGLSIFSDRLVYTVDTSKSMRGMRIYSLRENLIQSLHSLKRSTEGALGRGRQEIKYNIVDFGGDVVVMDSRGLTDDFDKGVDRAQEMPLTLGTRSYDAMERSLWFNEMDTIYFLSDGAPYWGQLESWNSIITAMDLLCLYRQTAIFCVAFDPSGGNEDAMKALATQCFGLYEAPAI